MKAFGLVLATRAVVFAAAVVLGGCGRLGGGAALAADTAGKDDPPRLKDQMRQPWALPAAGYIRQWLVCGPMPSPRPQGNLTEGGAVGTGFDADFLKDAGGEAGVRPAAGAKVKAPDGAAAQWRAYDSPTDEVDLTKAFAGQKTDYVVAYAWATIQRPADGNGVLAVGSDDSVKVWLNGALVHDHRVARAVSKDEDLVPVAFRKGANTLLAKVDNGTGGWGLVVRVLGAGAVAGLEAAEIRPVIDPPPPGKPQFLAVRTDSLPPRTNPAGPSVHVEVVAPGGKVVAAAEAQRGEGVRFDTANWADGPYDIRVWRARPDGPNGQAGSNVYRHLPWYKGEWQALACQLIDACAKLPTNSTTPADLRLKVIGQIVLDRLGGVAPKAPPTTGPATGPATKAAAAGAGAGAFSSAAGGLAKPAEPQPPANGGPAPAAPGPTAPAPSDLGWGPIHSPLMEYAEWLLGEAGAIHADGFLRLAWIDEVDGSPQYARAYLPPDYDPKGAGRRWPMVVALHGYNPPNPEYVHWWSVTDRHCGLADEHGVIVVEPHGRGNTGYMGIGDADVLRAIAQAKAAFRVDDARVYLMGHSMGGGGTWHVGTRHPGLFAAIGPIYGGWDYHVWMKEEDLAKLTPPRRFQAESSSSFVQADDLLTTPVFVNHGDADDLVDPNNSRYAVRMLQRWGYDIRYWEHPGLGHGGLGCEDTLLSWFLARRLEADPRHVRVRAGRLKSAEAHWVRVEQREDPTALIHVDARAVDRNTLRVDTANVLQVRLSPRQAIVDRSKPIRVIWNGELVGDIAMDDGAIVLRAKTYVPGKLFKTPELAGPLDDVQATPFAIVAGTIAKDPLMRRFCLVRAQTARDDWKEWQKVEPRYFLDTRISDEQIRKYTLILFGGPEENLVTQRLAKDLPLKLTPEGVTLAGRHLPAKDASVVMVYPHPLTAGRYVCVHAGNSPAGMFFTNRFVEDADFTVTDALAPQEETPLEDVCVVSGSFDCHWQYEDRFAFRGDPAKRAKAAAMKAPTVLSAAAAGAAGGASLWLADLLPAKAAGSFALMQRDRNWQGRPIRLGGKAYDRGIGVEVWHEPCVATFDLTGGDYKRLRATIGIEVDKPEKLEPKQKDGTKVCFLVRGGGKELYRSPTFNWDSPPVEMNVPVAGVKTLELEVANEATWHNAATSVDWADVRVEK